MGELPVTECLHCVSQLPIQVELSPGVNENYILMFANEELDLSGVNRDPSAQDLGKCPKCGFAFLQPCEYHRVLVGDS